MGSSTAMEYEGFKRSMTVISAQPCGVSTFVSDRHTSVVKHMREQLAHIIHYYDLWHVEKSMKLSAVILIMNGIVHTLFLCQ